MKIRFLVVFLTFLWSISFGSTLSGLISSSAYTFAREDLNNNSVLHFRTYQSVLLTGNNIGLKDSRFNLSGIFYYDPASDFGDENHYRYKIYNFNYQKRLLSNRLRLRLGRQSVYTSSVYGRINGLSSEYIHKAFKLRLFAGGYVPASGSTGDPVGSHLIGVELGWLKSDRMQFSLGVSNKALAREKTPNGVEVPATIQSRVGLKGRFNLDKISLFMLARINPNDFTLKHFNSFIDYSYGRISHLTLEYKIIEPRIPDNSIFSVFDTYNTKEYRISSEYKLSQSLSGSFQYRIIQFNDDNSQVISMGIRVKTISVNLTHQDGYGGASNRITGQFHHQIKRINVFGRATVGNYKLIQGSWDDVATYVVGSRIPLLSRMWVRTELQFLQNKYYNQDVRFLFNLSYRI